VEIVRLFFNGVERLLQTWGPQRSLLDAMKSGEVPPEAGETLGYMNPDIEWNPVFSSETYQGPLEIARGWDELLGAAANYSLKLLDVTDLDNDRVLAVFGPSLEGRTSGIRVDAAVFAVVTLQNGLIVRLDEYSDRQDALEAAGLSE
jgi:ketosteroid isomerase-like protein